MKRIWQWILVATILTAACKSENKQIEKNYQMPKTAKGNKNYGGVFRLNETEYVKNLFPASITDAYSYRVASQIYEGLFKFDQANLKVIKCLAESYQIDPTNTIYTIKLKKGIYFHDDECFPNKQGRELKAEDVKYCFTQLCTQSVHNQGFSVFEGILQGADKYYKASAAGKKPNFEVEGIKVIDDYTIQLTLIKPNAIFLYNLARPFTFIYPKEAWDKYQIDMRIKTVGTGPFYLAQVDPGISIILKRNHSYHDVDELGNRLPFLEALQIKFIQDKKTELFEFKKGNLDMIYRLPTEFIIEILEESEKNTKGEITAFELQRNPEMTTQFLTFFTQGKTFDNKELRKAFSYAIDREKILEFVLNGEGYAPGLHGITPPVFANYDIAKIKGYTLNLDSARFYLKKAGYNHGKDVPKITLQLNAEGERNTNVALEVQKQLKDHLDVNIEIQVFPFAQLIENNLSGKFDFLRAAWYADYPSPENFLWLFLGKNVPASLDQQSFPNTARYKNPQYDALYEKAINAKTLEEANSHFLEAEQLMMNDAPIIVLWYDEAFRLIKKNVRDFPNNAMQYRDFSKVYFEKVAKP